MKKTNGTEQHRGDPAAEAGNFDWETLPDLAKDRWEAAVAYDLTVETRLANAQSGQSHAELERQKVAGEILVATIEVCHEITSDAQKALASAKQLEFDAVRKLLEAKAAIKNAGSTLKEGGANAEMIVSHARKEAEEILARARVAAGKESEQIIHQTTQKARKMLAQVEMMKAAAQEDMETLRIYTRVSRLKAECLEELSQVNRWVNQAQKSLKSSPGDTDGSSRCLQVPCDLPGEDVAESLSWGTPRPPRRLK